MEFLNNTLTQEEIHFESNYLNFEYKYTNKQNELFDVEHLDYNIVCSTISDDGKFFVLGTQQDFTLIFDAENLVLMRKINTQSNQVQFYFQNSDILVTGGYDANLKIWSIQKGTPLKILHKIHNEQISSFSLSYCNQKVVSASYDQTIKIFNIENSILQRIIYFQQNVEVVQFNKECTNFVTLESGNYPVLKVWDARIFKCIKKIHNINNKYDSLSFSFDGQKIAVAGHNNNIQILNANNYELIIQIDNAHKQSISYVTFCQNQLVSADQIGLIKLWSLDFQKNQFLKLHNDQITTVQFNYIQNKLLSGSLDQQLIIWEIQKKKIMNI